MGIPIQISGTYQKGARLTVGRLRYRGQIQLLDPFLAFISALRIHAQSPHPLSFLGMRIELSREMDHILGFSAFIGAGDQGCVLPLAAFPPGLLSESGGH